MKKFILGLALTATMVLATPDRQAQIMEDMRLMLVAMEEIQRAGLYSSTQEMKEGVKKLQKTLKVLESDDVKLILPKDQVYAYQFAQKTAKMLRLYSDDMIVSIDAGRMDDALEDYTQLLKQCTSCHIRIRSW